MKEVKEKLKTTMNTSELEVYFNEIFDEYYQLYLKSTESSKRQGGQLRFHKKLTLKNKSKKRLFRRSLNPNNKINKHSILIINTYLVIK